MIAINKCEDNAAASHCLLKYGQCHIDDDGYYVEIVISVGFGIIWFPWARRTLKYLQNLPVEDWHVIPSKKKYQIEKEFKEDETKALKLSNY